MANSRLVKYVCVKLWRRYWIFFALALIVLIIQGLLAYNFYTFNSLNEEDYTLRGNTGRSKGNVQLTNEHSQQRSNIYQDPLVNRYIEDYAVDDEDSPSNLFDRAAKDSSSRNGPLKENFDQRQDLVARVLVKDANTNIGGNPSINLNSKLKNLGGSSNVAAIGDAIINMGVNKSYENLKLSLEELDFKPWCNISTKESISAIHRAKSQKCKQEIANLTCLIQNSSLYPERLPRFCPLDDEFPFKYLGCFRDETKQRILSGFFARLSDNSPRRCVDKCLRLGFQYAGVQYSNQCFCGKNEPLKSFKVPESKCDRACPKSPSIHCGGFLAMNVYRTGLPKFVKRELVIPPKWSSPRNVRIVFLLTINGRALRQVKRLLKALYHKRHYFYIHVDSRQDYLYRELLPLENKLPNIRLSRWRLSTIWGGASLLKMLLGCISDILDITEWKWDYVINLSESDFPIKSLEKLEMFLTANKGMNFVKSHGQDTQRFIAKQGLDKSFYECDNHMWRLGERPLPWGIKMDGGSDWVALNHNFCSYVTSKLGRKDELLEGLKTVFQYTLLPAESFFHTVLQNSAFCQYIVDNNLHITNWKRKQGCKCQYKHIVDWCGCSPNDFKLEDWPRIQSTEERPFFFARKFEPSVCQSIIEQVERWTLGPKELSVPSTFSYWQNEYHYLDTSPVSDSFLSIFASFGRLGIKQLREAGEGSCLPTFLKVLTANLYFEDDDYKGTLVQYEALLPNLKDPVILETQVRPINKFTVHKATGPVGSLKQIQVGSDFDQKELVFRNFGRILGPYSEPAAVHRWGAVSQSFPITFIWVDPVGTVAGSYEIRVEPGNNQILYHKPTFRQPLRPGVWSLLLMQDWILCAEAQFLIVPLSVYDGKPVNREKANFLHNGPDQPYIDLDFSQVENLLSTIKTSKMDLYVNKKIGPPLEAKRQALLDSQRIGFSLEIWIDGLVSKFWSTQTTCFKALPTHLTGGALCPGLDLERCHETTWSSLSPDPKSEITKVDSVTGRLK